MKVEKEDSEEVQMIRRFKVVKALFAASQTAGDDLPPYERPDWSIDHALKKLEIEQVPFQSYEGNTQGYATERRIAINPVAVYPLKTALHEISHVELGHTAPEKLGEYQAHRGRFEFEAEASAHVVLKELDELDDTTASVSRAYVQGWLRDEKPSDQSLRVVLNVATRVLDAGYAASD